MDYPVNKAAPLMMHIDLNSCFASVEQQANTSLRGKPVGVAANVSLGGCVISPSKEMKARGVKIGRVRDVLAIIPEATIIPPDPDKYFYIHQRFSELFKEYSPHVVPLSIDEAVISFDGLLGLHGKDMVQIGQEIKDRMQAEIGDWLTCNVGIGTNRFLAKLAAGLHKPDGLDVVTHENLREVYSGLDLLDLCGINTRNKVRLVMAGIYTPVDFFDAPVWKLWKQVFNSVAGYQWYMRLRGWEVDDVSYGRKSYGQQYALHHFTSENQDLSRLMMKLCEKMGRRLRRSGHYAQGIDVYCSFVDHTGWHKAKKTSMILYHTGDLHGFAMQLFAGRPAKKVTHLSVTCYGLKPKGQLPQTLFDTEVEKRMRIADALDACNDKYGEYSVHPAAMVGMENEVIKRVPFHATTDTLSEIYDPNPTTTGGLVTSDHY
jgi:DNA polymerase-4